jgi:hypothetical protein
VCQFALRDMQFDADRGKHLRELSFEVSLAKGEMAKKLLVKILSRRGGKAPKRDPLQKLIEEIA